MEITFQILLDVALGFFAVISLGLLVGQIIDRVTDRLS